MRKPAAHSIRAWLISIPALLFSVSAEAVDLRFSGFGDVIYGYSFGKAPDETAQALFESDGYGTNPVNMHDGFSITGADFVVIADFSDNMRFLSEINLQAGRSASNEIELDVERMFVDYTITPEFNLQGGLYFTPIGYFNRFLYSRAWLMNSVQIPDLFEEELNLVPTHTIGLSLYGSRFFDNGHSINYAFSVGNGRAVAPDQAVYARDPSKTKEFTWLFEWIIPGNKDSRIGLSGWMDRIASYQLDNIGDSGSTDTATPMELSEVGFNPYVVWNIGQVSVLAEYVYAKQKDELGGLPEKSYTFNGFITEVALHLQGNRVHPYIRYDRTNLPKNSGPYYGLREDGGDIARVFVPEFDAAMVGVAYDRTVHNRLKIEFIHHFDGARPSNGILFQSAYGF